MHYGTPIEAVLKRDRIVVMFGLAGVAALAWVYIFYLAWDMKIAMPYMSVWGVVDFVLMFVMWAVMMVAMMIPSTAPMVLLFATINRRHREHQGTFVSTAVFLLGYLIVWAGFSALATLAQWGLHTAALLSPTMVSTSPIFGGALLMAAGVFQLTPFKHACLAHCRSPLGFLMTGWREGARGALIMGLQHGSYCVGCCWILMSLLFVTGVMNLLWMAIITALVLIEKIAPAGFWVSRAVGLLLTGWGVWIAARALP